MPPPKINGFNNGNHSAFVHQTAIPVGPKIL